MGHFKDGVVEARSEVCVGHFKDGVVNVRSVV